jgi:hypothetical protein
MNWVLCRPGTRNVLGKRGDVSIGSPEQKTYSTRESARAAEKRMAKKGEKYWAMRESDAMVWDWEADLPF